MVKARLIRPLDGQPEGSTMELDKADFERLKALGAVEAGGSDDGAKAAPPVESNKAAPPVANKAAPPPSRPTR